jgi:hypothetical protein
MKILLIIGFTFPFISLCQSDMQKVVSSSGNHFNNGVFQLSFTIGEPIINTLSGTTLKMSQGFHQSKTLTVSIAENNPNVDFKVFPNPVGDKLYINSEYYEGFFYEIFDNNGKLICKDFLQQNITEIETDNLKPSEYTLYITGKKSSSNFKLIKINKP